MGQGGGGGFFQKRRGLLVFTTFSSSSSSTQDDKADKAKEREREKVSFDMVSEREEDLISGSCTFPRFGLTFFSLIKRKDTNLT